MSRQIGPLALVLAGWLGAECAVQAQIRVIPSYQQAFPYNPFWRVAPGVSQAQYLASVRAYARTAATIPPYLYGYNPYPNPIVSTGPIINPNPVSPFNPYAPAVGGGYPGVTNPYTPTGSAYAPGVTNPYTPVGADPYAGGAAYSGYYDPAGGTLRGGADMMRAYGSLMQNAEQARIIRQQAYQARLDTVRKKFDLDMYIKANTPSFTEEQARVANLTLKRIQNGATAGEISSGKSLNVLLDDLRKFSGKKITSELPALPEDILLSLNVSSNSGTLGILREGKIPVWPAALQEIYTPADLKGIEDQLLGQMKSAETKGGVDPNVLKDLRKKLDEARDELGKKVNEIATSEYLNGKRFLNDLDQARIALERGEAKHQFEFMKWARAGARSPQDLVDYLTARGLKVAPSTLTDEAAYRAAHSALAALDVQMNAQFASAAPPDYKE